MWGARLERRVTGASAASQAKAKAKAKAERWEQPHRCTEAETPWPLGSLWLPPLFRVIFSPFYVSIFARLYVWETKPTRTIL